MFYITTPIYYVNAKPHLGTTYTTVLADVLSRYHQLRNEKTFFLTGTDEHGINIERLASSRGVSPQEHCDELALEFKKTWEALHIAYDDFIRTTEKRHEEVVQQVFERLLAQGDLYKGFYKGWYCPRCESYYSLEELVEEKCPTHQINVEFIEEETYFFRWSKYQDKLLKYYQENPDFVIPEGRFREIISFVEQGVKDISVSRSEVSWGIPVLSDPSHSVYVWLDALLNYVSAIGYLKDEEFFNSCWPPSVQVMAKDIIRHHAALWPAILMALKLPLPKHLMVHEYLLVVGSKMSKSGGNIFNPLVIMEELQKGTGISKEVSADALRYFLVRDGSERSDSDMSLDLIFKRYNSDLSNDWGNFINRVFGFMNKVALNHVPKNIEPLDPKFLEKVNTTSKNYIQSMISLSPKEALKTVNEFVRFLNTYIDSKKPWSSIEEDRDNTLYHSLEGIRIAAILLIPIMPYTSQMVLEALNYKVEKNLDEELNLLRLKPETPINTKFPPLFPRLQ